MILELLFAFVSVLFSMTGMVAFGVGIVLFLALPVFPKITGMAQWANRLYLYLATQSISRAAIVVSEHNDVYFKQMQFCSRGVEKITLGSETKEFEDPDSALHYWMGIPFALADEVSGVLFDPRHAALGQRKHDSDERDQSNFLATTEEWEEFEVSEWVRGVFEMPRQHELVNLSRVRELVDGGERSEYPKRVEELYRHSRDPFGDGLPVMKFLMPAVAFLVTFGGLWLIVTRLGGSANGQSTTIEFGALSFLFLSLQRVDREEIVKQLKKADWKRIGKIFGVWLSILGSLALMVVLLGPLMAAFLLVIIGMGFCLLPILATLSRPVGPLAGAFSQLFFKLGFLGYQRPVFEWTPQKYVLRDYSELETTERPTWYNLFGTLIGFTYAPEPESWGAEVMDKSELEAYQMVTDGGAQPQTNVPGQYVRTESMRRDSYGAFLPKRLKRRKYYLHTGIALARFKHSAVGQKSLRRLLGAKEKFGENGSTISDKTLLYMTAAGGFVGVALGVLVFLL